NQTPETQQLLAQLNEAQSQLKVALTSLQPEHPKVLNLKDKVAVFQSLLKQQTGQVIGKNQPALKNLQIGDLRQNLLQEFARTETDYLALEKKIDQLSQNLLAYKERAKKLPKLEQTQRQLERKLQASQASYESLLKKLKEVQLAENQNIGNVRVISPAFIPEQPTASRKKLIIGGGIVFGALLGV
ncbi:GNVR domain-containing protein, partial [Calothrix rhizosoleniae]|uniref:GNVR domain-containing protein n=1 Tax=Calothrix rhizosoleniae TaxID=888997 RepID=UPI002E0FC54B